MCSWLESDYLHQKCLRSGEHMYHDCMIQADETCCIEEREENLRSSSIRQFAASASKEPFQQQASAILLKPHRPHNPHIA